MTALELEDWEACDQILARMAASPEMADTTQAVAFYRELRQKEIENALTILDCWIRSRNIPISDTINNFTEFLQIIIKFAETLINFGVIEAAKVLLRSADYFALTLTKAI